MENYTTLFISLATGLLSFFGGLKTARATAQSSELDNVEKALAIYRKMVEDLTAEIKTLRDELVTVSAQNMLLIKENRELREKLNALDRRLGEIDHQVTNHTKSNGTDNS